VVLGLACLWGPALLSTPGPNSTGQPAASRVGARKSRKVERRLEESRALAKQLESLGKIAQSPDKLLILKNLTQLIPE